MPTHAERARHKQKIEKCWPAIDDDAARREEDAAAAGEGVLCLHVHERDKEQLVSHRKIHDSVLRASRFWCHLVQHGVHYGITF